MSVFLPLGKIKETLAKRRPMLVCVLGLTLLTAACNTAPSKQTTSNDTATNALANNDNSDNEIATNEQKQICRNQEVTGTRFKGRVCHTKANWDTIDEGG